MKRACYRIRKVAAGERERAGESGREREGGSERGRARGRGGSEGVREGEGESERESGKERGRSGSVTSVKADVWIRVNVWVCASARSAC